MTTRHKATGRGPGSTGSDFLHLDAGRAPERGLTDWLTAQLRTAVLDGRLEVGTRLPATRELAADLGVARGVVVAAYQRLADEGLTTSRPRAGTTVASSWREPRASHPPESHPPASHPSPEGPVGHAPDGAASAHRPASAWMRGEAAAVDLDLSPGLPDLTSFPRAAWLRAEREVLDHATAADLGYGDPAGHPALRHELAHWLARTRGTRAGPDDIMVVAGVAQSLALLAQVQVARGHHRIGVEDPGSRGAADELVHWGLEPVPVPVDDDGLDTDRLETADPPTVLVTPAHQFPTGVVLHPRRRQQLLAWAAPRRALVIEDDYDAEHRYDRPPTPALQASAPDVVAHTGSTSKSLAPGLRLGWLIPPPALRHDLLEAKYATDIASPALSQLVLGRLLASGAYDRHLRRARARQRARRDAMLTAVRRHLPQAQVQGVAAGLHLLLTFPDSDWSDAALADGLLGGGLRVQPLSWHRHSPGPPGLVLGYAAHPATQLQLAIRRIAEAID